MRTQQRDASGTGRRTVPRPDPAGRGRGRRGVAARLRRAFARLTRRPGERSERQTTYDALRAWWQ